MRGVFWIGLDSGDTASCSVVVASGWLLLAALNIEESSCLLLSELSLSEGKLHFDERVPQLN